MKLIKPYAEIWEQNPGILGIYEQIERCARVCYKSEDKIGEGTAEKMVEMLKKNEHTAMLEHGTVYLYASHNTTEHCGLNVDKYYDNPYSVVLENVESNEDENTFYNCYFITTNYRVIVENGWEEDLRYLCKPTKHRRRITAHFVCDRGVSHELVRHRVFSFAQESTRYCNYNKDKFGNELTFIEPCWNFDEPVEYFRDGEWPYFRSALKKAEDVYRELTIDGWTPQQARAVLPNALKTEVCMTGFMSDWEHFFNLRCDKAAHPQIRELAIPLEKLIMR